MKLNTEMTSNEMYFAMQFYLLELFNMLDVEVTGIQCIGEVSSLENNDIVYSVNLLEVNGSTDVVPTMCFISEGSLYVIINTCGDLNIVVDEYISLDKNGQIVFDRAGFINSDCGKEIRIDLDMCKTDFIKGTDDFKRYKSLGLME